MCSIVLRFGGAVETHRSSSGKLFVGCSCFTVHLLYVWQRGLRVADQVRRSPLYIPASGSWERLEAQSVFMMAGRQQSTQQWVEKYRPKQVKDVAYQDEVVKTLTNTLETGNLPHLLFYGPPGTGKTSTALALAHQLFGPALYKSRVLELNASDDRGINVVRTKIKDFAAIAVGNSHTAPDYPCPPFKIIILDEADSMTEDAQNALRRTMETYSKVTRFCFICNYVSRIIEPLASRCAKYRFKPLNEDIMTIRVRHVCQEEGIQLSPEALSTLSKVSGGDLRRAITVLQSAARLYGSSISGANIISVSGVVPDDVLDSFVAACKSGQFDKAQAVVSNIIAEGYPASQILNQLFDIVVSSPDITDEQKARILERIAETDKALIDGADEFLQLLDVASNTLGALCNLSQELTAF
ncbi:hypothetical protein R1flu_020555 [Riccia fluitans]|uniref:AAA+ ATPase domain-containing protein n=1 Tax=Riccia fluitans TaxID=41844 RepID=A0ABD1ZLU9_9MARC